MISFDHFESFISAWSVSPLKGWSLTAPWDLTAHSESIVRSLLDQLDLPDYVVTGEVAKHRTATVEPGAVLKGPLIIGPHCFIATGAYLRGGNWIGECCIVGPGAELKSSFVFSNSTLAHFNFVGDSIIGENVNLEAGSIICNCRNEREDKQVLVAVNGSLFSTGQTKFGALVGDSCRFGANSVVAPGTLLKPGTVVERASLLDQEKV